MDVPTYVAPLVSLVRVAKNVSGFRVDPVGASGPAVTNRGELAVVAILAVDVLKKIETVLCCF